MSFSKSSTWFNLLAAFALLLTPALTEAKKPDSPGGGSDGGGQSTSPYELVDLLGFENGNGWYQSGASFITDRDADGVSIISGGALYSYPDGSAEGSPAIWQAYADGFLGPFDQGTPESVDRVEPVDINYFGISVFQGSGWDENGDSFSRSFVKVSGGGYRELEGVESLLGRDTDVTAINDLGTIAGDLVVPDPETIVDDAGCLWQLDAQNVPGPPTILRDFLPSDINNFGVMSGISTAGNQPGAAIAWLEDGALIVRKLQLTGGAYTGANLVALNDRPVGDPMLTVVGRAVGQEVPMQAFAWRPFDTDSPNIFLGTLDQGNYSEAFDVNARGEIVGFSNTRTQGHHAFIYANGVLSDLNDMVDTGKATLEWAVGINGDGDVVGIMDYSRPISQQHAFLLRRQNSK